MVDEVMFRKVICEVVRRFEGLSRTQLVKVVYLIDREYYMEEGEALTGVHYKLSFWGPTSHAFRDVMEGMVDEGILFEWFDGEKYHILMNKDMECEDNDEKLVEVINSALEGIVNEGELMSPKNLVRHVFSLEEVKDSEFLSTIKFKR